MSRLEGRSYEIGKSSPSMSYLEELCAKVDPASDAGEDIHNWMLERACAEVDSLRTRLAVAEKDRDAAIDREHETTERLLKAEQANAALEADNRGLNQLWSDTTAELLTCRTALNMLKADIKPMAAQIIHPKDNVMSRMIAVIDNALQATYAASRESSEPSALAPKEGNAP